MIMSNALQINKCGTCIRKVYKGRLCIRKVYKRGLYIYMFTCVYLSVHHLAHLTSSAVCISTMSKQSVVVLRTTRKDAAPTEM